MAWAPAYVATKLARDFLKINDEVDDTFLGLAVEAASRAIDVSCNRQFGLADGLEQRFYTGTWDRSRSRWVVEFDDLMSVTGFAAVVQDSEGATVGTIDDYVLEPRNAAVKSRPWTRLMVRPNSTQRPTGMADEVAITLRPGWTAIPDTIEQACLLQLNRFFNRRESPYGVAGSPDLGSELRLLARLDVDVAVMVSDFRRWWAAA